MNLFASSATMKGYDLKTPASLVQVTIFGRPFRFSRFTFLLVLGALVGAATGGVAVVFRLAAHHGQDFFFPYHGQPGRLDLFSLAALRRLLMPAVGGLLSGLLLFRIMRFKGTHGIPAILRSVASGQNYFKIKMAIPAALTIVTLATGGSAGPEGPIAEIGSVTGSQIGRWAGVPPRLVKTLIGSGVAAGIAAVFNAPIAGVFFAIEVILRNYEIASFTPIAVAAVVASAIAQAVLGNQMAIAIPMLSIPQRELPFFAVLGLICGLISLVYIHALNWFHHWFLGWRAPQWLKPACGGLLVGLAGLWFPQVMGEGYEWIRQTLVSPFGVTFLLALVVLKIVATGVTLGSGNPGGSFAPAVFIGVMGGAAYGALLHQTGWAASGMPYAVMGMAGLVGGALGAPLTAILITLRNAQNYSDILLPVMTTVALCAFVMQLRRNITVYTLDLLRMGIDLDLARQSDPLSLVKISAVAHSGGYEELPARMMLREAIDRFKDSAARWFVVLDERGGFAGIVSLHEMRMAIAEQELAQLLTLGDITDPFLPRLHPEMSLKDALASFNQTEAEVLPVFENPQPGAALTGFISRQDALNAYCELTELA